MEQKSRTQRVERSILQLGVLLLVAEAVGLLVVAAVRPALFGKMVAVISAILVGGRLASIPTGLALGFRTGELICFLSFFNLMWLLIVYSLIVRLSNGIRSRGLVGRMVQDTHKIAGKQRSRIARYGTVGLAIFVWLPLPWSGSVVGAVVGLLMGLSAERIMLVVVPSMFAGITTWTLSLKYLFDVAQLEKWTSAGLAACILLLALLLRLHRARRRENKRN